MKRTRLILILLLVIFHSAELKIEDDLSFLREEASKAIKNLFGFSFSFTNILLDREVTIHQGNPTITAKLSLSCSKILRESKSGYIKIKQGVVVSKNGTDITCPNLSSAGQYLDADFENMTLTLSKKLQGAVTNGTIYFSTSSIPLQITITIIFTKTNEDNSCDGTLTLSIKEEKYPTPPSNFSCEIYNKNNMKIQHTPLLITHERKKNNIQCRPSYNNENIKNAGKIAAECGGIAIAAFALSKLIKGAAFFVIGGPVGGLIGLAT